tara:strand:+ start:68 stop:277 length:210 start_codon:yes stop_codon:yes gene_type:complete
MKRRIIITIDSDSITDADAIHRVSQVIDGGKISKHKETLQYCFVTTFADNTKVYARDKKNINTDSFVVW